MTRTRGRHRRFSFFFISLALGLSLGVQSLAHAQTKAYGIQENVVYWESRDVELNLDIAWPTKGQGPFPAILFLPGNGWGWWRSENRGTYYLDIRESAKRGYVAAVADCRPASGDEEPKYPFPAQLYDVKTAVRWLRLNASKYNIDSQHIGVVGFSSGGHLALLLGLTVPSDGLEGEGVDESISSEVQAVVSIAAPTELLSLYKGAEHPKEALANLVGCRAEECPQKYKAASPVTYARLGAAPILIIHGSADAQVPVGQALALDSRFNETGTPHELAILKNGKHENIVLDDQIWDFLSSNLKVPRY